MEKSKQGLVAHGSTAALIMPATNTDNESAVVYLWAKSLTKTLAVLQTHYLDSILRLLLTPKPL